MNAFVEECRREWKRLGVPDQVADEMAVDLAADLEEAASDGVSATDVLGSGALDPRSFAATWATERGVVPAGPNRRRSRSASVALAAFLTLAVLVMIGASVAILTADSDSRLAVPDGEPFRIVAPPPPANISPVTFPVPPRLVVTPDGLWMTVGEAAEESIDPVGWALLIVGLIGIVPASLLWASWARPRPPTPA